MTNTIAFRTRARTIDHLGREQIADCPTAVSELWKNAYDAYATSVELHIFDGDVPIAAVVDDGHGMSLEDFAERWLVVGTEAKADDSEVPETDRFGLLRREKHGQKGIGRLSVAALGPVTLVISKRRQQPFVTALVDWRIFENPYLNIEDIFIPVEQFSDPSSFQSILAGMLDALIDNVWGRNSTRERNQRIELAWKRHDEIAPQVGGQSPSMRIANSVLTASIGTRHLSQWNVWRGEEDHGTALFVLGANYELAVWNTPVADERDESSQIRGLMKATLTGFVDPFTPPDDRAGVFRFRVINHIGIHESGLLSGDEHFGLEDLFSLEHFIEGVFDESGTFRGRVRAFGKDIPEIEVTPAEPPPLSGPGYVGPLQFCVGTFEQTQMNSTHPPEQHRDLLKQAERFAGLAVYRDGLRVMPYGRPDADYFGMEERRSFHAGRSFWSHRRSFGRVAISRSRNPNLRDKAGREGLIDNRARRELRNLVANLLQHAALKFFGTDSELRKQHLPEIQARNEAAQAADEKAGRRRKTVFSDAIRKNNASLDEALLRAQAISDALKRVVEARAVERLPEFDDRVAEVTAKRAELRLPPRPAKLGKLEETYRSYRDRYSEFSSIVSQIREDWSAAVEALGTRDPEEAARSALARHQKYLHDKLDAWHRDLQALLDREQRKHGEELEADRARYYRDASPLLIELRDGRLRLAAVLIRLEMIREEVYADFATRYGSYHRALEQLADKIDIDAALVWSSERRAELERSVEQLHSLAQLGVTVEIISHELNELDSEVDRGLRRLPKQVQEHDGYQMAMSAHRALMERLRFLAPLKLSGPRLKEELVGEDIYFYLKSFFRSQIEARSVRFQATSSFRKLKFVEYRSRIYPVFTNLVNNALYWLGRVEDREICIDFRDSVVVVADSGPGVDPDDIEHLFELFFTRRAEGRGVGLYLCRVNLEMGGHTIKYATEEKDRILKGANFSIHLRGNKNG